MLASLASLLEAQATQGGAVGAFTCYNFELAAAVLQAAERYRVGIILLVSEKSFAAQHGPYLVASLRALAEQAPVPVCLQLDHVSDLAQIETAFKLGVNAVMADGSRLPLEANIAFSREAAALAHSYNGHIEVELGRIEGNEDVAMATRVGALTDPEQAAAFVSEVNPACLAVSIGNIHGIYTQPPLLDWERLERIRQRIATPLSLHGASGLADEDVRRAIRQGIRKVNINTELRERYLDTLSTTVQSSLPGSRLLDLQLSVMAALREVAEAKLRLYMGGH